MSLDHSSFINISVSEYLIKALTEFPHFRVLVCAIKTRGDGGIIVQT